MNLDEQEKLLLNPVKKFSSSLLQHHGFITHGFMGRCGHRGTWTGPQDKNTTEQQSSILNNVKAKVEALWCVKQVHSARVITVEAPMDPEKGWEEADGMVCKVPGIFLGIITADCAPVLFADPKAGVIGAAHAGWRGALEGVLENTILSMEKLGATRGDIVAAIGPCIQQESYEVDDNFRQNFLRAANSEKFFVPGSCTGRWHFDLPGYIHHRLHEAGLQHIDDLPQDTLTDEDSFYSYRRMTLKHQGAPTGRQISLIGMPYFKSEE